jgi:hypothetical protein
MNRPTVIRMLTYVLLFIGIYKGTEGIAKKDHHQGLRNFLSIGVIPTSLLAAFRHMFLSGQIIQGGRFFEQHEQQCNGDYFLNICYLSVNGCCCLGYFQTKGENVDVDGEISVDDGGVGIFFLYSLYALMY